MPSADNLQKPQDQTRIKMSNVHGHNCEHSPLGMRYMGTHEEPAHETSHFSSQMRPPTLRIHDVSGERTQDQKRSIFEERETATH
jgi:hypothetical protein